MRTQYKLYAMDLHPTLILNLDAPDCQPEFLEHKGYKPMYVGSENEAKKFNILNDSKEYPIYFFKTDTSGEKEFEEFYTESEDFHLNKYVSLGYIKTSSAYISSHDVMSDFESLFNNPRSTKLDLISIIKKYVPDFIHNETGKHLDQKM